MLSERQLARLKISGRINSGRLTEPAEPSLSISKQPTFQASDLETPPLTAAGPVRARSGRRMKKGHMSTGRLVQLNPILQKKAPWLALPPAPTLHK